MNLHLLLRSKYHAPGILLFFFLHITLFAQVSILKPTQFEELSLHPYATFWHAGDNDVSFEKVKQLSSDAFLAFPDEVNDFGFTKDQFWIRFEIENKTDDKLIYYLETSRPITDRVSLYTLQSNTLISSEYTGDLIPYSERAFNHRKSIFKVELEPQSDYLYYLMLKSDGEVINGSVYLRTDENLHAQSAFEQMVFGFFYGILLIAAILYLFFFFAMKERSFLYYSLYVIFIGLLQFSLDGYFYQFFTPEAGWLSQRSVFITATIANFLLGRYAQVFLNVNRYSKFMQYGFYTVFSLDFLLLIAIIIFPGALFYSYPIANILGLLILSLIIGSIIVIYRKTGKIDGFFTTGIFFLVAGFVVFILKNFSVLPVSFWTENSSKLGTGMEVIFLSLSMANLIKRLRDEREELKDLALVKSEEMNELKSYFLSNISHELRTPLNAILSLSDAIKTENKDEETQKKTEIIKYSAVGLLNSVNDILDFSKIEKNELKLELSDFNLKTTLQQILKHAELQAIDKNLGFNVNFKGEFPEKCHGDASRLAQIVQNVLSNALKFTEQGFIRCEFEMISKGKGKSDFMITIADTGVGIPKEKMKSIFDSFSQESINNKRKFGGLGLGLYIVKSLVDLFGGNIDMQSLPAQGTVCKMVLPLQVVKSEKIEVPTTSQIQDYDLGGKRILVVEDNAMNQMVIKMITKKWLNTQVVFANNGLEGLQTLKGSNFDVVLMDLQMPVMDGYEATIAIRNGEAGKEKSNIPIIAVTADVMETTKTRVKEIGMNHYLSKPVDKEVLYKSVCSLVL
ncbi:MAG: 7TM diverse intracellular signaling domain-containing protein [Flavobacterium sp.]